MITVGLAGLHNSGKSKLMNGLTDELEKMGFSILRIGGRRAVRKKVKDEKNAIERQTLMLAEMLSDLIQVKNNPEYDVVFLERDPWDFIAFSEALIKAKIVTRQEIKPLISVAEVNTKYIDLPILILVSEDTSIRRRKKDYILDPIVGNYLFDFEGAYRVLEKRLPYGSVVLSGEDEYFDENLNQVLELLISRVERRPNGKLKN